MASPLAEAHLPTPRLLLLAGALRGRGRDLFRAAERLDLEGIVAKRLTDPYPGLPTDWVRVLEEHPEGSKALPGYVWLETPGKVLHVAQRELEFTDQPPE